MRLAADAAAFTVQTDVFEGPLDLLLYLVKRDGVDLADLQLAPIADAYLSYLDRMRELDLALAADWLVWAATLVHWKSLELLPRTPTSIDEEDDDPRERLRLQLEAYELARRGADALDALPREGRQTFVRPPLQARAAGRPVGTPIDAFGLLDLYWELLRRPAPPDPTHRAPGEGPSIGACCRRVLRFVAHPGDRRALDTMLRGMAHKADRVITFIATLEMARLGWITLTQYGHLTEVEVERVAPDTAIDLSLLEGQPDEPQMTLPLDTWDESDDT